MDRMIVTPILIEQVMPGRQLAKGLASEYSVAPDTTRRLLTGGTGFMGSHFLLSLYARASHTSVLTRGNDAVDASARLARSKASWARTAEAV